MGVMIMMGMVVEVVIVVVMMLTLSAENLESVGFLTEIVRLARRWEFR